MEQMELSYIVGENAKAISVAKLKKLHSDRKSKDTVIKQIRATKGH